MKEPVTHRVINIRRRAYAAFGKGAISALGDASSYSRGYVYNLLAMTQFSDDALKHLESVLDAKEAWDEAHNKSQ